LNPLAYPHCHWARLFLQPGSVNACIHEKEKEGIGGINSSLTACRQRRCVSRVEVPRKELFVHLSSNGKQRLSNQVLKFPMGKAAGRSAREPRRSLVNELEMPALWSEGEGRRLREQNEHPPSGSSGVAGMACGGRDTVQDGRPATVLAPNQQPRRIRDTEIAEGRWGSRRGS